MEETNILATVATSYIAEFAQYNLIGHLVIRTGRERV